MIEVDSDGVLEAGNERLDGERPEVDAAQLVPVAEHDVRHRRVVALAREAVVGQRVAGQACALVLGLARHAQLRAHAPRLARVSLEAVHAVRLQEQVGGARTDQPLGGAVAVVRTDYAVVAQPLRATQLKEEHVRNAYYETAKGYLLLHRFRLGSRGGRRTADWPTRKPCCCRTCERDVRILTRQSGSAGESSRSAREIPDTPARRSRRCSPEYHHNEISTDKRRSSTCLMALQFYQGHITCFSLFLFAGQFIEAFC